jgi:Uma2 family endonuclease
MATDLAPPPIAATDLRPDDPDALYEVIDGRIVEKRMGALEVQTAGLLITHLLTHARQQGLGTAEMELLFLIDPARGMKRRPDVAFVSRDRWPIDEPAPQAEAWDVVPDLAVEVVSPTNFAGDLVEKIEDYFRAGVRQIWAVYPVQEVVHVFDSRTTAHILRRDDTLEGGEVVPGFRLPLATIFRRKPVTPA